MLVLGQKKGPQRIVLRDAVRASKGVKAQPEAYVVMAPITRPMRRRAMEAARQVLGQVESLDDVSPLVLMDSADAAARELIRMGALEWGGIGDADNHVLELTPDRETRLRTALDKDRPTGTIDLLLDEDQYMMKIEADYTGPDRSRQAEKNASPPLQNGTGGAGTRARTIAGSPANRKARRTAAKNAPTGKAGSKAKPAKKSGRS